MSNSKPCMIYPMVPFLLSFSDAKRRFRGHGDALDELCAQLTRDLFAITKFLFIIARQHTDARY